MFYIGIPRLGLAPKLSPPPRTRNLSYVKSRRRKKRRMRVRKRRQIRTRVVTATHLQSSRTVRSLARIPEKHMTLGSTLVFDEEEGSYLLRHGAGVDTTDTRGPERVCRSVFSGLVIALLGCATQVPEGKDPGSAQLGLGLGLGWGFPVVLPGNIKGGCRFECDLPLLSFTALHSSPFHTTRIAQVGLPRT